MTGYNLTKILDFIKKENEPEIKKIDNNKIQTDKINANIAFYIPKNNNIVISKGFLCILHHITGEYEIEIIKMDKKLVITEATTKTILKSNKKGNFTEKDRIILRKDCFTIGYGVIL